MYELADLVSIPYSRGRSPHYSNRLHGFPITIPRYFMDVYINSFIPGIARLCNSLAAECFGLTYQNDCKSGVNRHLLSLGSVKSAFLDASYIFLFLFVVTPPFLVVQP